MFRHTSALESLMLQRPIYPAPPHGRNLTTEQPSSSLYSGKWTMEEENYVSCLCEEFRAGSLAVPEGKSLRCFLADTLGCNAKRISKKYERTGYHGKLQYVDRRKTMTSQDLQKRQEKMQEFEQKFRESRETLKIVEASRKRPAPSLTPTMMTTAHAGLPSHHHHHHNTLSTVAALQAGLGGAGGIPATAYLPAAKRARTAASILLSTPAPIHHLGGGTASAGALSAPSLAALTLPLSTGAGVQAADLLGHAHHAATQDTEPSPSSLLLQRALANTNNHSKSDIMRASMLAALQKRCDPTTATAAAGFQLLSRGQGGGGTADPPSSASTLRDHEASPVLPSSRLERLSSVAAILEKAQRQTSITSVSSSNAAAEEDALLDAEVAASSSAVSSTSSIAAGLLAFRHAAAVPAHHITAAHHQLHSNYN